MPEVNFRFYEELNDFSPENRQKTDFEIAFKSKRSIKDMIEALGVPHTEVDLILINGKSVDFDYIIKSGDRIRPFSRCLLCNNLLERIPKENILDRIPSKVRDLYDENNHCKSCGRIYWKGSHQVKLQNIIDQILP